MENQSYYRSRIMSADDVDDSTVPLQINCTGYVNITRPFATASRRRDWYLQLMDEGALFTDAYGTLSAGQFLIRPPETNYRYELREPAPMCYYWVHFTGSWAENLLAQNRIEPNRVYTIREEQLSSLRRVFGLMFREFMLRRPGYADMAASLLTSVIVRLGRGVLSDSTDAVDNGLRKRLEQSAAYIHSHYMENISVTALADMEHLSESRFREVFREAFGTPPGEYIIGLRISHACELLLETDLTVSEVAEICGYPDVLYFSRLFRRKTGSSPAAYRKEIAAR